MSQFPQLLAQSHTAYTVMTRMGPPDKSLLYWKAPDGTTALTWNAVHSYGWGTQVTSNRGQEGRERFQKEIEEISKTTPGPIFMTWGSDLFAPPPDLVEKVHAFTKDFPAAHFHLSTPSTFFQQAAKSGAIPELSGEIPSAWGRETTAVAHIWSLNVPALNTLLTAEKFAAINYAHGYADYPQQQFDFLWMKLLEFMDHNQDGQGGLLGDEAKPGTQKWPSTRAVKSWTICYATLPSACGSR